MKKKALAKIGTAIAVMVAAPIGSSLKHFFYDSEDVNKKQESMLMNNIQKQIKDQYITNSPMMQPPVGPTTAKKLGIESFQNKNNAIITYQVLTQDLKNGMDWVKATVTIGKTSHLFNFNVTGFNGQNQIDVNNSINQISDALSAVNKNTVAAYKIPLGSATPTQLGIDAWLTHIPGVTLTFDVINNLGDGFLNVRVTATKDRVVSTKDIRIIGFSELASTFVFTTQNKAQVTQENVDAVKDAINSFSYELTTTRTNIKPSSINKGLVTAADLGVTLTPPKGVEFVYEVTDNTGDGFLIVKMTVSKGTAVAIKNIKVIGFKIKTNLEIANLALDSISDRIPTIKPNIYPGLFNIGQKITPDEIGILLTPPIGVVYTYEVMGNSEEGILSIKVSATVGTDVATKTIKIIGLLQNDNNLKYQEETKITNQWCYQFNNKWYDTKKQAEDAQLSLKTIVPQIWLQGHRPSTGSNVSVPSGGSIAYKYNSRVYRTKHQAEAVWVKARAHRTFANAATTQEIKEIVISRSDTSKVIASSASGIDASKITIRAGGFHGFFIDGKYYLTKAMAEVAYTKNHSSEIKFKQKFIYNGINYETMLEATRAADAFAVSIGDLILTHNAQTLNSPNKLPVKSYIHKIISIEDIYNN